MPKWPIAFDVLCQYAPCFHGFYRAIISIPFDWSSDEWCSLARHLNMLFEAEVVERLNRLPIDALSSTGEDIEKIQYMQTLVSRYVSRGRPMSGYFIVCCVIEAQWTILAQVLGRAYSAEEIASTHEEAEAANIAWRKLLRYGTPGSEFTDDVQRGLLRATMKYALQTFATLLLQIQEMDADPAEDSYCWETMSEGLVSRPSSDSITLDKAVHFLSRRNSLQYAAQRWANWMLASMTA